MRNKLTHIFLILWQLPQFLLGRYLSKKSLPVHKIKGVKIYLTNNIDGISLANTIMFNYLALEGTWLIKHEYGHVIQSRMLGWLYVPIILIPSYIWYRYVERISKIKGSEWGLSVYYKFYTESWANKLVGIKVPKYKDIKKS